MVDTNAPPDLERNMPSHTDPPQTVRRRKIYEERPLSSCGNTEFEVSSQTKPDAIDEAKQCCFLCLQSRNGPYAIQVPCRRAGSHRQLSDLLKSQTKEVGLTENASENDAVIWNRMLDRCYNEIGKWRRRLPFYGPVSVQEVQFGFVAVKDRDGLYKICDVTPVDNEKVENAADHIIAENERWNNPIVVQFTGEFCCEYQHHPECPVSSLEEHHFGSQTCIQDEASEATKRKHKLKRVHLLNECARNPPMANGLETLAGMAQDSCIYNTEKVIVPQHGEPYGLNERIRGIEMIMGWQRDRIYLYAPRLLAWSALGMAIIWLCILAWGGQSKDWGGAMTFGQLLAAFLAIILSSVKD